ncbi:MAG TPA: hypothetical protein VJ882_05375, partial [Desulfuromonadales bacterium]|nr:hypothetical protein [Desulfuromonadales bacterium]
PLPRKTTSNDAVFSWRSGVGGLDMAKSNWVYKKLKTNLRGKFCVPTVPALFGPKFALSQT